VLIARVTGTVVATRKERHLEGKKMLLVQPLGLDLQADGPESMALDAVQAGAGDLVLIVNEGGSSNRVFGTKVAPFDMVIVGIIDTIDLHA
jgi:ethanolamine utilization protein EutN